MVQYMRGIWEEQRELLLLRLKKESCILTNNGLVKWRCILPATRTSFQGIIQENWNYGMWGNQMQVYTPWKLIKINF